MSTIAERVAAGAAFLDQRDPGWFRTDVRRPVNLDHLDMAEENRCVLGQRCPAEMLCDAPEHMGGYEVLGAHLSGLAVTGIGDLDAWAVPLGFQATVTGDHRGEEEEYDALSGEWRRVITVRRAAL